jgi:chromosome segregation ATPase
MARMTYHEAAAALGITLESVRRTARKKRWAKLDSNDGLARVEIPDELLAARQQDPPEDRPEDDPQDEALIARLDEEIASLKAIVESERRRADEASQRAARLEGEAEGLRGVIGAEQRRADSERERADRLQSRVEELLVEQARLTSQQEAVQSLEEQIAELRALVEAKASRRWWQWRKAG